LYTVQIYKFSQHQEYLFFRSRIISFEDESPYREPETYKHLKVYISSHIYHE